MKRFIPVAAPALVGNEEAYVLDCLRSTWISSNGKYIEKFERAFAEFCGVRYGVSCCNGTAALHLALLALGIGSGDQVIVPTLTFVASANAVTYCGATAVFVDCEPQTWNLDPTKIEALITPATKAIIVVHLYGHPVDMDAVLQIARKRRIYVIEDSSQAHGAEYKGSRVGSLGDIATFSFYGNKVITTGEGGIVVTDDQTLTRKVRELRNQGMDPDNRYWFPIVGYNYRMTNIAAAIGLAQLEKIDWHLKQKRKVAHRYADNLKHVPGISLQEEESWAHSVYWMNSIVLDEKLSISRDFMMSKLAEVGIETRAVFHPMHKLPIYKDSSLGISFPVADRLAANGINLPSSATISDDDIDFVCEQVTRILETPD